MKKKLLLLLSVAATFVPAATILCSPSNLNSITGGVTTSPLVVSCGTVNATAGFEITGLAVRIVASFNDTVGGTNHQLEFVGTNTFNAALVTAQTDVNDFVASTGAVTGAAVAVANLATLGSVDVSVTTASLGGFANPNNASFTAFLVTTETSLVPEPSTMALFGSALVGLGMIARRRK